MASGKERYVENLITLFPEEKEAIKKYMELIVVSLFVSLYCTYQAEILCCDFFLPYLEILKCVKW